MESLLVRCFPRSSRACEGNAGGCRSLAAAVGWSGADTQGANRVIKYMWQRDAY